MPSAATTIAVSAKPGERRSAAHGLAQVLPQDVEVGGERRSARVGDGVEPARADGSRGGCAPIAREEGADLRAVLGAEAGRIETQQRAGRDASGLPRGEPAGAGQPHELRQPARLASATARPNGVMR